MLQLTAPDRMASAIITVFCCRCRVVTYQPRDLIDVLKMASLSKCVLDCRKFFDMSRSGNLVYGYNLVPNR